MTYSATDEWNSRAASYNPPDVGELGTNLLALLRQYWQDGDSVLEVGSGIGRIFELVMAEAHGCGLNISYTMCDISAVMAERCYLATGQKPVVYPVDAELPFDTGAFDWVISFSVLLHVPPADIQRAIFDLARVSRRYVFVSTFDNSGNHNVGPVAHRHDYAPLFDACGLRVLDALHVPSEDQYQWLLVKGDE